MSIHLKKRVSPHKHLKSDIVEAREVRPDRPPYRGVHSTDVIVDGTLTLDETLPPCDGAQGASFPENPVDGQFFYRTDLHKLYRWDESLNKWIQVDVETFNVESGTSFPVSPQDGDLFYRTDLDTLFRYSTTDGWQSAVLTSGEGTSFPAKAHRGDFWFRTDEGKLYRCDQDECTIAAHWTWVAIKTTLAASGTSFPVSPVEGELFYRTDQNALYRWNGSSWDLVVYTSGEGTSFPSDPFEGQMWYRTDEGKLYRWNGSSWVFIAVKTPIDVDDVTPKTPSAPTLSADNITVETVVDLDGTTHTYFIVTFARVSDASGYILSYRKAGTTDFVHIMVEQVASGNVVVKTGFVELNTAYYFKACSLNEHQEASAWSSEVTKTSGQDTTPPSVPTGLSATGLAGGILLEWNEVSAYDFSHYNVYVSDTTTPPAFPTFTTRQNYCYYKTNDYGTTKYFWISSEDVSENESDKCSYASASASKIGATDLGTGAVASEHLKKGIQPYNSNITFEPKTGDKHDSVSWGAGTIKFADGGQQAINAGSFDNLSVGIHYIYFTYGSSALSQSTVYSDILGDTKGLLAIVGVVSDADQEMSIQPFYAKGLNIVADVIAANAIFAEAIQAGAVEASKIETSTITGSEADRILEDGSIKTAKILSLNADKVLIDGTVYLSNWRHGTDSTKIDGGEIYTGSVLADQIGASQIAISKLSSETLARIFSSSDLKTLIEAWRYGETTFIDGGDLYTGTVHTKKIKFDRISSSAEETSLGADAGNLWWRDDVDQLRFKSDTGIEKILKQPLYAVPAENLASFACFELKAAEKWPCPAGDKDAAEGWRIAGWDYGAQNPYAELYTADSYKGKQCIRIFLGGTAGWFGITTYPNDLIPIKPNQKYFCKVAAKSTGAMNSALSFIVTYYDKSLTHISGEYGFPFGEQDVTASWQEFSGNVKSPANAKYAKIYVGISTPSINYSLFVDDVVFSEQKAMVPTQESVAADDDATGASVSVPNLTWTELVSITVPSENHETLFARCEIERKLSNAGFSGEVRLRVGTHYYPSSAGVHVWCGATASGGSHAFCTLTIPKNCAGLPVKLEYYTGVPDDYYGKIEVWGHSPHKHQ